MEVALGFMLGASAVVGALGSIPVSMMLAKKAEARRRLARLSKVWEKTSKLTDGRLVAGKGQGEVRHVPRMVAQRHGVKIAACFQGETGSGARAIERTRVTSNAMAPKSLRLSVHKQGVLEGIESSPDCVDFSTGIERFDEEFVVRTNAPELARFWINQESIPFFVATHAYRYDLQNGKLYAHRLGWERHPSLLASVIETVGFLGARGEALMDRLEVIASRLAGTLDVDPDSFVPEGTFIEAPWGNRRIVVDFVQRRETLGDGSAVWNTDIVCMEPTNLRETAVVMTRDVPDSFLGPTVTLETLTPIAWEGRRAS